MDSQMEAEKAAERAADSEQDTSCHTWLCRNTTMQRSSPYNPSPKSSNGTIRSESAYAEHGYAEYGCAGDGCGQVALDLQMEAEMDLQMEAERVPERAVDAVGVYAGYAYAGCVDGADGGCGRPRCNRHMPISIVRAQRGHGPMREHVWRCEAAAREAVPAPVREAVPVPAREAVPAPARTEATVEARLVAGEPESTYWSSCSSSRGPRSCNCHTHTHIHTIINSRVCLRLRGKSGGCALRCSKEARLSCKGKISPSGGAWRAILVSTIDAVRSIRALLLDASVALMAARADLTIFRMLAAVLLIGAVRALAARRFGAGFDRAAMGGP